MLTPTQNKQIQKIDKHHKELDNTKDVWAILEEITMEGLKVVEREKQDISIIENQPDRFMDWLIRNLEHRIAINKIRKKTLNTFSADLNKVTSFLQKESRYLKQDKLKLAELYMDNGNYILAAPLLKELSETMPGSGEVKFHLGCIAMESDQYQEATHLFDAAIQSNPNLKRHIEARIQKFGDDFLNFAVYFKTEPGRELSVKYMVQKGLKYHPAHSGLKKELELILENDLKAIQSDLEKEDYDTPAPLAGEWHKYLIEHKKGFIDLPNVMTGRIYLFQGRILAHQREYQTAIDAFETAINLEPENTAPHSALIDTLFLAGDFANGIQALDKAIQLETTFAGYWETIGDSLKNGGQYEDAILAYEKCFVHLPDRINLLRKIGDCYMETDQLEAAKAAYSKLKDRLQE